MVRTHLLLILAACGCTQGQPIGGPCEKFGTGEEPCVQQIYFPSGIAMDPDGDVLYVTSSNADLRYSGGAVHALDTLRFECAASFFRDGATPPECADAHVRVTGADGKVTSVTLDQQAPVDAAGCRFDLLDTRIVECDETPFVLSAVKVGNFAGSVRVQGRGADARRLWLPVRGDPSITFVAVVKPHPNMPGDFTSAAQTVLQCNDPNAGTSRLASCNAQRITVRDFHPAPSSCGQDADCPGGATCNGGTCSSVPLPPEPFGIALDEGTYPGTGTPYHRLLVTHLLGGEVTVINTGLDNPVSTEDQPPPPEPVVTDVRGGFFSPDASGRRGGFGLAALRPGDGTSLWYLTSRVNPLVSLFRVNEEGRILPTGAFSVAAGPLLVGSDIRDFVVEPPDAPGGDPARAFFVDNNPPSLLTLDTRLTVPEAGPSGLPSDSVVDEVPVCEGPSHLALRRWTEPGAPGGPDRVVTRAYAVCFGTGQVAVVDPDLSLLVDTISSGRGANDMAFNFGAPFPEPKHRRGYVANFTDSTVSVIDLDRGSPTENRVVFRIGTSEPPPSM